MQCHRYIELNPVRAAMVDDPREYRWSSHHALAFGDADPVLTAHPGYLALSSDQGTRQRIYRDMVIAGIDPDAVQSIRCHLQSQHAYGGDRFKETIEAQLGRTVGPQKIGRPRKQDEARSGRSEPSQFTLIEI